MLFCLFLSHFPVKNDTPKRVSIFMMFQVVLLMIINTANVLIKCLVLHWFLYVWLLWRAVSTVRTRHELVGISAAMERGQGHAWPTSKKVTCFMSLIDSPLLNTQLSHSEENILLSNSCLTLAAPLKPMLIDWNWMYSLKRRLLFRWFLSRAVHAAGWSSQSPTSANKPPLTRSPLWSMQCAVLRHISRPFIKWLDGRMLAGDCHHGCLMTDLDGSSDRLCASFLPFDRSASGLWWESQFWDPHWEFSASQVYTSLF